MKPKPIEIHFIGAVHTTRLQTRIEATFGIPGRPTNQVQRLFTFLKENNVKQLGVEHYFPDLPIYRTSIGHRYWLAVQKRAEHSGIDIKPLYNNTAQQALTDLRFQLFMFSHRRDHAQLLDWIQYAKKCKIAYQKLKGTRHETVGQINCQLFDEITTHLQKQLIPDDNIATIIFDIARALSVDASKEMYENAKATNSEYNLVGISHASHIQHLYGTPAHLILENGAENIADPKTIEQDIKAYKKHTQLIQKLKNSQNPNPALNI